MLSAYPMLALSAARLFGPPPAMELIEYWPSENWGAHSTTAMTMQIEVSLFGEGMVSSPFRRKSDPTEQVLLSLCGLRDSQPLQAV
jgi:hypothetical protein